MEAQVLEVLVAEGAVPRILSSFIGGDVATGDDLGIDEDVLDGEDVILFCAPLADAVPADLRGERLDQSDHLGVGHGFDQDLRPLGRVLGQGDGPHISVLDLPVHQPDVAEKRDGVVVEPHIFHDHFLSLLTVFQDIPGRSCTDRPAARCISPHFPPASGRTCPRRRRQASAVRPPRWWRRSRPQNRTGPRLQ